MRFNGVPSRYANQDNIRERDLGREYQQNGPRMKKKSEEQNLSDMGLRLKALFCTLFALGKDRRQKHELKEEKHSS